MGGGAYPRYRTAEALEFAVDAYFAAKEVDGKAPTMAGLALGLGFMSSSTLRSYEDKGEEYATIITVARTRVEEWKNELLLSGGKATLGVIFDLKNNHGWMDKSEQKVTVGADGSLAALMSQLQGKVLRPTLTASFSDIEDAEFIDAIEDDYSDLI